MNEFPFQLPVSDQSISLLNQIIDFRKTINNKLNRAKSVNHFLCPICQNGYLQEVKRGKLFGVISDIWLICSQCKAEFDKQLKNMTLKKINLDSQGIGKNYLNKTLILDEWKALPIKMITKTAQIAEQKLIEELQNQLNDQVVQKILSGDLKILMADISGFLLKKAEKPILAAPTQMTIDDSMEHGTFLLTVHNIYFKGQALNIKVIPIEKITALYKEPDVDILTVIQDNRKPVSFNLQTNFKAKVSGVDLTISFDIVKVFQTLHAT